MRQNMIVLAMTATSRMTDALHEGLPLVEQGAKRTWRLGGPMSVNDPKRTFMRRQKREVSCSGGEGVRKPSQSPGSEFTSAETVQHSPP